MRLAPADSIGERALRAHFAFQRIERAVAATAAATVAAATMILRSEDDMLALDVEISGHRARQRTCFRFGKIRGDDAAAADAHDVACFFGNPREQIGRKVLRGAPALAFVSRGRGELALILPTA